MSAQIEAFEDCPEIGVSVSDKLHKEDYEKFLPYVDEVTKEHGLIHGFSKFNEKIHELKVSNNQFLKSSFNQ